MDTGVTVIGMLWFSLFTSVTWQRGFNFFLALPKVIWANSGNVLNVLWLYIWVVSTIYGCYG